MSLADEHYTVSRGACWRIGPTPPCPAHAKSIRVATDLVVTEKTARSGEGPRTDHEQPSGSSPRTPIGSRPTPRTSKRWTISTMHGRTERTARQSPPPPVVPRLPRCGLRTCSLARLPSPPALTRHGQCLGGHLHRLLHRPPLVAKHVQHHAGPHSQGSPAQAQAQDGAQVVLELVALASLVCVVAGVVGPGSGCGRGRKGLRV